MFDETSGAISWYRPTYSPLAIREGTPHLQGCKEPRQETDVAERMFCLYESFVDYAPVPQGRTT